ncbi:hypothetical protein ACQKPE_15310 [Pseudomonas sp. NPDC089554]|uniref:hypothetical protein n=1 Tax=Pseudomonas sp. NPDC089554 TaxID=3390653 RepID=UPI003D053ADF
MKNQLILTLALSVFAAGAFAEDGFKRTNAHDFATAQNQVASFLKDGYDNTNGARPTENGSDNTNGARFAEDGFDRTNGARFAEDGFDRTNGARFAEDGFDRTNGHRIS